MIKFSPLPDDSQIARDSAVSARPLLVLTTAMCTLVGTTPTATVQVDLFKHDGLRIELGKGFYELGAANAGAVEVGIDFVTETGTNGESFTPYDITVNGFDVMSRLEAEGITPVPAYTITIDGAPVGFAHPEFNKITFERMGRALKAGVVVDTTGFSDASQPLVAAEAEAE